MDSRQEIGQPQRRFPLRVSDGAAGCTPPVLFAQTFFVVDEAPTSRFGARDRSRYAFLDTTTTTASVDFGQTDCRPVARAEVSVRATIWFSESGKKQAAPSISRSRTITAPSCSGDCLLKIASNRSTESLASSAVPLDVFAQAGLALRSRSAHRALHGPRRNAAAATSSRPVGSAIASSSSRARRKETPAADLLECAPQLRLKHDRHASRLFPGADTA